MNAKIILNFPNYVIFGDFERATKTVYTARIDAILVSLKSSESQLSTCRPRVLTMIINPFDDVLEIPISFTATKFLFLKRISFTTTLFTATMDA